MSETALIMHDSDINRKAFGKRVRLLRARLGLKQDDLAIQIGVRRQTIAQWEAGDNAPQAMHMARFEEIERGAAKPTPGQSPSVNAVYEAGAVDLRVWLKGYTGRVIHALGDAFLRETAATTATQSVAADAAAVGQPDAQTPARRTKSG